MSRTSYKTKQEVIDAIKAMREFPRYAERTHEPAEEAVCLATRGVSEQYPGGWSWNTVARVAKSAITQLKEQGINVGLVRPITVWPFPYDAVREACCQPNVKAVLDVELNEGQMLEDIKLAINGDKPVDFFGHCGSQMPSTDEIVAKILSMKEGK